MLTGRKWRLKDLERGDIVRLWNGEYKIYRMSPQIIIYKVDEWGGVQRSCKAIFGSNCMMIVELAFTQGVEGESEVAGKKKNYKGIPIAKFAKKRKTAISFDTRSDYSKTSH